MKLDDAQVGGQLLVGTGVYRAIKQGPERINGSAGIEGPVVMGAPLTFGDSEATLMVGPCLNDDPDNQTPYSSLGVSGTTPTALKTKGNTYIEGDLYVTGSVDCQSTGRLEARHVKADKSPKLFDMEHPSPEMKGYRLSHACIEGPEVGVYYRGRLRNQKEIILPDYWKDLVHMNSISVQLQPIGAHQDIIIKRWDIQKIYLQSKSGIPIDCFYHVYAERKDVNGLIVEYEGESCEDHPDRKGDDPKYADTMNTRTI
jgi:hypothetical protein|tara:strand:- start:345 stop:1115 length:771 start_codon:yes stop_codon:yes gene_type:complete